MKLKTAFTTAFAGAVLLAFAPKDSFAQVAAPKDSAIAKTADTAKTEKKKKETRKEKRARKAAAAQFTLDSIANEKYAHMRHAFEGFGLEILGEETAPGAAERKFILIKDVPTDDSASRKVKFYEASYTEEKGAFNIHELSKPYSPDATWTGVFKTAEKFFKDLGYTVLAGEKEMVGCCDKGVVYLLKKNDTPVDQKVYLGEYTTGGSAVTRVVPLPKPCPPVLNKSLTFPK